MTKGDVPRAALKCVDVIVGDHVPHAMTAAIAKDNRWSSGRDDVILYQTPRVVTAEVQSFVIWLNYVGDVRKALPYLETDIAADKYDSTDVALKLHIFKPASVGMTGSEARKIYRRIHLLHSHALVASKLNQTCSTRYRHRRYAVDRVKVKRKRRCERDCVSSFAHAFEHAANTSGVIELTVRKSTQPFAPYRHWTADKKEHLRIKVSRVGYSNCRAAFCRSVCD